MHNAFWDIVMYQISEGFIWIPFYLWFLFVIIRNYKKQTYLILICIVILITLSDQITTEFFKPTFHRLRPYHTLGDILHYVNGYHGGQYGFISSHAANTFGLAGFLIPLLKNKIKYFSVLILFWASIVSYSRVYLGVHYPADVACGAIFGYLLALLMNQFRMVISRKLKLPECE